MLVARAVDIDEADGPAACGETAAEAGCASPNVARATAAETARTERNLFIEI
jgi:hypothetical protein